jgi:CBS-domain-containing membrane protein
MNRAVADVMHAVAPAGLHATYREIITSLADQRIGALPVIDDHGRVMGVVSEADLLRIRTRHNALRHSTPHRDRHRMMARRAARPTAPTAQSLMSSPAIATTASTTVQQAIAQLTVNDIRQLPVVDSDGQLLGYVSRADLVRAELLRPDIEIRHEVIHQVIETWMSIDPASVDVDVRDGIVTLTGQVETEAVLAQLVQFVEHVPGVVGVDDRLSASRRTAHNSA